MRNVYLIIKPILAGIIVAGALSVVLWQQLGALYSPIYPDPTSRLVYLFIHHLVPGLFAIAVTAGLVSGSIGSVGKLSNASVRGAVTAFTFGMIAFPLYIVVSSQHHQVSSSVTHHATMPSLIAFIAYLILAIIAIAFFVLIGSAPYVVAASISAAFGAYLRQQSKSLLVVSVFLALSITLCLIMIQGASLRAQLRVYKEAGKRVEPLIRQNLVDIPVKYNWQPPDTQFPSKIPLVRCSIPDGRVMVKLQNDGKIKSANVLITTPRGIKLRNKESVATILHDHGTSKAIVQKVKKSSQTFWYSRRGKYSASVSEWQAPVD